MSGTDHKHPTFGVCTCGHLDFMHPWTSGERVDYQGPCENVTKIHDLHIYCDCQAFHADPLTTARP
jgi:hypothetical protein